MKYVGAHVKTVGGIFEAAVNAFRINAKSFALFVKNQMQWNVPPLEDDTINKFKENLKKYEYTVDKVLPHNSYLINLGNPYKEKRKKSLDSFLSEAKRCEQLGLIYLNFHPGSHLGQISESECIKNIVECLNYAIDNTEFITFVIENTAGQGGNVGYKFEHIRDIIEGIKDKSRVGVCLDTCHTYTAGYDITIKDKYEETFITFDKIVGLKYLKALHINDSKKGLGSRIDRHENLGKGVMGLDVFKFIMNDKRFDNIPLILETIDDTLWEREIKMLYDFIES